VERNHRGCCKARRDPHQIPGGEPTLRKDFRELTEVVQRSGVISSVTTNGQRMATEPRLFDYLDEAVFSLDALDSEKNGFHRGRGVLANVMRAIDHAFDRQTRVYIKMVVSTEIHDQIEPLLEFCERRGIGFHAQPVQVDWSYPDEEATALTLSDPDVRNMHLKMAEWKRAGRPLMFCAETYERTARWPDYTKFQLFGDKPSDCMAGRYYLHIEPNGDVYPCGLNVDRFSAKNILRDGLQTALKAARQHNCHAGAGASPPPAPAG